MRKIEKYELSQQSYISIMSGKGRSYGGNQEWFPKDEGSIKDTITHQYGCGVIAITDLFLYWAITQPNGKETLAGQYLDEKNQISKENYMKLVEIIRDQYAQIYGRAGTFAPQLTKAINRYADEHFIGYTAQLDMNLNDLTMLKRMKQMLQENQPIILMIGHSVPVVLSRRRKKGIPFYRQIKRVNVFRKYENRSYAIYRLMKKNIFGHFVTVTGLVIDEKADKAHEHIMLKITSWGTQYYISYHHLRQYINQVSNQSLTGMISII